jgi:hypothetical protein
VPFCDRVWSRMLGSKRLCDGLAVPPTIGDMDTREEAVAHATVRIIIYAPFFSHSGQHPSS